MEPSVVSRAPEVLNAVGQLNRHPEKKRRLLMTEAKVLIHRLETDATGLKILRPPVE